MSEPVSAIAAGKMLFSPTFVAGAVGAFVSLRFAEGLSNRGKVMSIVSGSLISFYLTPALVHLMPRLFPIESPLAFVLGLFGLNLTAAIHTWVKQLDVPGILKARWGK